MSEKKRDTILFVDDEIVCHSLVSLVVDSFTDYKLITALNGRDAVELAKQNSDRLFLVLSDIMLPDIKGYQIFNILQEEPNLVGVPFIFQSGLAAQQKELKKHITQETIFIDKPYKQEKLLELIRNVEENYPEKQ